MKNTIAFTAICLSFFLVILDATIVNIALPNITQQLHASITSLQWVVAGYTLMLASLLLLAGNLSDLLGAKKILLLGLLLFGISSLACALAPNIGALIAFRLVQGIAGATLVPCSLSLINALYPSPAARAKAFGIWGGIGGIAAALGPLLGALLIHWFNWRAIFVINLPIALLTLYLIKRYSIDSAAQEKARFDYLGQCLIITVFASLAFGLIEAGRLGWSSPLVLISLFITVISLGLFLLVEQRVSQPMLPLAFFKSANFSSSLFIGMSINICFYGQLFLLPLYFQHIRHYSILETGFALFPLVISAAFSPYLSGHLASRKGARLPLIMGLLISLFGVLSLYAVLLLHHLAYYYFVLPFLAIGFGAAFIMPAATLLAIGAVPHNRAGIAAASFTSCRQLGSLLGVAIFGNIIAHSSQFVVGMRLTLLISVGLFCVGGGLAWRMKVVGAKNRN